MRIAGVGIAIIAMIAIAMPLAVADSLQSSQARYREGNLPAALSDARSAAAVEPFAAAPRLQEALVLEQAGSLGPAEAAGRAAAAKESEGWRNWVILSRIETVSPVFE